MLSSYPRRKAGEGSRSLPTVLPSGGGGGKGMGWVQLHVGNRWKIYLTSPIVCGLRVSFEKKQKLKKKGGRRTIRNSISVMLTLDIFNGGT